MLEIKTITENYPSLFDRAVNEALEDGWERIVDEPEEELEADDGTAEWKLSRDPLYPFRCTACGYKSQDALRNCPHCKRVMVMPE